jgi:hypothetical protein
MEICFRGHGHPENMRGGPLRPPFPMSMQSGQHAPDHRAVITAEGARVTVLLAAGLVGPHLPEFDPLHGQYSPDSRLELHLAAMQTVAVDVAAIPHELTPISQLAGPEGIATVAIHIQVYLTICQGRLGAADHSGEKEKRQCPACRRAAGAVKKRAHGDSRSGTETPWPVFIDARLSPVGTRKRTLSFKATSIRDEDRGGNQPVGNQDR